MRIFSLRPPPPTWERRSVGQLRGAGGLGEFEQPRPENLHRPVAVLELAALVLHRDDDPGRDMGDPDRRVGRVDVLATGAARAVHVDLEIAFVDLDVDLVDVGQHGHGGR